MRYFITLLLSFILSSYVSATKIIPAKELYKSPDNFSFQLSPDAKNFTYRENEKDKENLILVDIETMTSTVISTLYFKDKFNLRKYTWTDNNTIYMEITGPKILRQKTFIHLTKKDGKYKAEFKLIKTKGYLVSPLPEIENKVLFVKTSSFRDDDDKLYIATFNKLENNLLSRLDLHPHNLSDVGRYYADENNNVLLASISNDDTVEYWKLDELKGDWYKFLTAEDKGYHFEPVGFLDEKTLAVLSNKDTDLISLFEFNVQTQEFGKLLFQHAKYDLISASVDTKKRRIEFVRYIDHGRLSTEYFIDTDKKLNEAISSAFVSKQILVVSKAIKSNKQIVKMFSSDDAGSYYLIDPNSLKAELILASFNDLKNYSMNKSQVFNLKATDGNDIEVILTRPKLNENGVLLVIPHGGPINVREYDMFDQQAQYFVSRGYSTLKVNFRGSSGFGKEFLKQGVGQFGKNIEEDISAAVTFINKKYKFNAQCSMGASYGGYSAVMLAIKHPDLYQCVIASFGVYDLPLLFNQTNLNLTEKNKESLERTVGKMSDELWQYSPLYYLEKLKAPILLIAGKKDRVADFEQSNRMKYRLEQLSARFETVFYESAGHGHSTWFGDRHELAYTDDFIRRSLDIPELKAENLSEIKRVEYMLIADGYSDDNFLKQDKVKAIKYYQLAADLDDSRAQMNLGANYHRGEVLEYSLKKAKHWYEKASENGYENASYRLGLLYTNENFGDINYKKSYDMFLLAKEQGNKLAYLDLAKFQCMGLVVPLDLDACITTLKLTKEKNHKRRLFFRSERERRTQIIHELLFRKELTQLLKTKLLSLMTDVYGIDYFNLEADIRSEGLYEEKLKYPYNVKHTDTTKLVPLLEGTEFGVVLEFETNDDIDRKKNDTVVRVKWKTPQLKDKNGVNILKKPFLSFINLNKRYRYSFTLAEEHMVEGEWTLELSSLDGNILYHTTFTTVSAEVYENL